MPVSRQQWRERIKDVERQYNTVRFGTERLRARVLVDPTIALNARITLYTPDSLRDLEATYFGRLFAEFESGLRSYWRVERPNRQPKAVHLLDNVAVHRAIQHDLRVNAHSVRLYRNHIVHENEHGENSAVVTIADARRHLELYFARLPYQW